MKHILTLIGGGDRDEVILQTAFAAASTGYIRRADDAASGLVETRPESHGYGVGAAGAFSGKVDAGFPLENATTA